MFLRVTVAPGKTASWGSVTLPVIDPLESCATTLAQREIISTRTAIIDRCEFIDHSHFQTVRNNREMFPLEHPSRQQISLVIPSQIRYGNVLSNRAEFFVA